MFVFTFDVWRITDGAAAGRLARPALDAHILDVGDAQPYRGSSLTRNSPPYRTTIGA